jgi:hypothetical protein
LNAEEPQTFIKRAIVGILSISSFGSFFLLERF